MTLERLTQITSVGITSGITLNNATLTGVTTITNLDSVSVGGTITAVNGTFSGNVSIAGTLTYEDVTNIDSVGLITAKSGIHVTGGSVGIGTDNAASKLTVYGTNQEDVIYISTGNNAGDTFANIRGDNESGIRIRGGGSYDGGTIELSGGLRDTDPGVIKFSTGTGISVDERLRIDNNGRIGIGSETPRYGLDVYTNNLLVSGSSAGNLILEDRGVGDSDRPFVLLASDGGDFKITSANRNASGTTTGSSERLRVTGIGSVGINRTNPSALLEIDSGGSYGIRGTVASKVGQSKRFIGKWSSGTTHNIAVVDGGTPRGQSRLGGFIVTFTYRSMYGFDGDGGGHGVRMLSGRVRDSGEWGFDTETNTAVGDTPVPTLQGTDNSDGTCTIQLVNPNSTHSFGEFNLIVWDCDIISPST
jgi:hypothetical protein